MNRWKNKLILTDIWQNGDVPESEVHLVGKEIANRLKRIYPDYVADDVLEEIIYYHWMNIFLILVGQMLSHPTMTSMPVCLIYMTGLMKINVCGYN